MKKEKQIHFNAAKHYAGFVEFCKYHNITQDHINACFGVDYFKKHPMYHNDKAINRISKWLFMGIEVKTVYPTNTTVRFDVISKPFRTLIHWIDVKKSNERPEESEKALKETFIDGLSERVLVYTKDKRENFARYHTTTKNWMVEGTTGFPNDYVTHFAYINSPNK